MADQDFGIGYFQRYLVPGRLIKTVCGDNRFLQRYWMSFFRRYLPSTSRVVEVGCGLGFMGRRIQEIFRYVGFDISLEALDYARTLNGIECTVNGRAERLPFRDEQFDALVAFDVVEHLPDPSIFFAEARRILRAGGIMVISTPNVRSLGVRLKAKSSSLVPSMYKDVTHVSLISPESWVGLMKNEGFDIKRYGTDVLWDLPYLERVPMIVQKLAVIPFNIVGSTLFGFFPWMLGENLVVIASR